MLRKKLLTRLGLLVVGFITGAVVSITLLQSVLRDLDAMNSQATTMIDLAQSLAAEVAAFEARRDHPDATTDADTIRSTLAKLASCPAVNRDGAPAASAYRRVIELLPDFLASSPRITADTFNAAIADLGALTLADVTAQQQALSRRLRLLIVGMTIAALVISNISVIVLMRTANMILRPVSQLVEGSRELAQEHFSYRVQTNMDDEFAELAHAYNRLAGELASNEQRKVEALRHLAATLNHELNNVISIIDLQLRLLDRRSSPDAAQSSSLREIHENLGRIARTIASLREVRRIVLTDYMPGQKMIDLPRSVAVDDVTPATSSTPVA